MLARMRKRKLRIRKGKFFEHEKQETLSEIGDWWDWKEPDFERKKNIRPWKSFKIHFRTREDRKKFAEVMGLSITSQRSRFGIHR